MIRPFAGDSYLFKIVSLTNNLVLESISINSMDISIDDLVHIEIDPDKLVFISL